jgi:hypothetical protein
MDRKINHKLFIFDTPKPTKNATLEQVKLPLQARLFMWLQLHLWLQEIQEIKKN